jgi:phosphoribosylglycinamide formyltransferase-1
MPNKPGKPLPPLRIAVLASGEGMTLQSLLDAVADGRLQGEIVAVVSNNADSGALLRARAAGIPGFHLSSATHADAASLDVALTNCLLAVSPDIVVTAGYMKRLGPQIMAAFRRRMINVHPSLLPKYGGAGMFDRHVHAAVLAAGEPECDYDSGPAIAQARVPVLAGDTVETLAERVKLRERELLIDVLAQYASTRQAPGNWRPFPHPKPGHEDTIAIAMFRCGGIAGSCWQRRVVPLGKPGRWAAGLRADRAGPGLAALCRSLSRRTVSPCPVAPTAPGVRHIIQP